MNRLNNNIATINTPQTHQKLQPKHSISLDSYKINAQLKRDTSSIIIPQQRYEDSASEFLELAPEMIEKLKKIDQNKNSQTKNSSIKKQKQNKALHATQKRQNSKLNKSVENQNEKKSRLFLKRQQEDRQSQQNIKKEFLSKLKQWSKQKDDIQKKKHYIQQKKQFLSQELQSKKMKEKQEEQQFIKLQKRKQIQQKIQQIQERRRKREESLKNAVMKRSYNGVPKYLEYEQKFIAKEEEESLLNLKLIKNKKIKMSLDPQQLKIHQKAYIQRIKQRLNMNSKKSPKKEGSDQHRRTNSDFNLYLKRSEQLKKVQLEKIIRRKKFQEKISKIPVKIDDQKKIEVLISIDKAKNPQKYHILSQKALNDQQIYNEFKDFNINLDPKQLGDDYLSQLKSKPKVAKVRSQSQLHTKTRSLDPEPLKSPVVLKHQNQQSKSAKELVLPAIKSKSQTATNEVKTYEQSLKRKKERDSKYLKQLQKKLAFLD